MAPDGRILRVREGGDPGGRPVLVHHGTPSSGLFYRPHVEDAAARGIRLLGYDRPGYGGSTPAPGRTIAAAAADVTAILDALGVEHVASWGASGGGPHVLACAALLQGRVVGVATLAAVAPYDVEGLDWLAGMGEDNLDEFGATLAGPEALTRYLERFAAGMLAAEPEQIADQIRSLVSEADAAVLTGEFAEYLHAATHDGIGHGFEGWRDDDLAFVAPWGFDLREIRVPVLLLQGAQDRMVPFAHGEWLAARIPGVDARLTQQDGHLTLEASVPEVHAWLLERF